MQNKLKKFPWEILIILLFLFMSITSCSRYTINFDEFFTMQWCRSSWHDFFYEVLHDTSPFLYYFMIRPFAIFTGQSILMARLFSLAALFILFMIGITFVKKNHGPKAMFFYLFILYLNPFMLQKSTEIRMYVWASAFTLLAGVFCYKLFVTPSRKNWILFTLYSLSAAYTHYYAVLTMIFLYLGLLTYFIYIHNKKELKNCILCSLVTVVAYIPFLLIAIAQIRESNGGWIHEPTSRLAPLKELFYSEISGSEYFYLAVLAGITLFSIFLLIRHKNVIYYWSFVCCSAIWGIMAVGILSAALGKPIMLSRYLIMPVCLLFLGAGPVVRHINKYIILLLCLSFALIGGIRYKASLETMHRDHTVETLEFAKEHIAEGDKIVLISGDDYLYNCTAYYIPQADIFYTGSFDPKQLKEENLNEFWFFDNGDYLSADELDLADFSIEKFGQYQFGYLRMNIYKMKAF